LLLAIFSGVAQAQQVQHIEITDTGIYKAEKTGTTATPGTPMGVTNFVSDIVLVERTTTIPAGVGTLFGFRYTIIGELDGAEVKLKFVNHYPAPGLRNPASGNTFMSGEYFMQRNLGTKHWKGYNFENDWELVPGTWTFEIWQGDQKLAEQSFTVVKP
jgi:hypothetical protein